MRLRENRKVEDQERTKGGYKPMQREQSLKAAHGRKTSASKKRRSTGQLCKGRQNQT